MRRITCTKRISYNVYQLDSTKEETITILHSVPYLLVISYLYDAYTKQISAPERTAWTETLHTLFFPSIPFDPEYPFVCASALPPLVRYWLVFPLDVQLASWVSVDSGISPCTLFSYIKEERWQEMVRETGRIFPWMLYSVLPIDSPILREAYVLYEMTCVMKERRTMWLEATWLVKILTPVYVEAIKTLLDCQLVVKHETEQSLALKWAVTQADAYFARADHFIHAHPGMTIQYVHQIDIQPILCKSVSFPPSQPVPAMPHILASDTLRALDVWIDKQALPLPFLSVNWHKREESEHQLLNHPQLTRIRCTQFRDGLNQWIMQQEEVGLPSFPPPFSLVLSASGTYSCEKIPHLSCVRFTQHVEATKSHGEFTTGQLCWIQASLHQKPEYHVFVRNSNDKHMMSFEKVHRYTAQAESCSFVDSLHLPSHMGYDRLFVLRSIHDSSRWVREALRIASPTTRVVLLCLQSNM